MTRILLFLLLVPTAWAADTKADARTASRDVLEVYLDRAAGARTEADWKTVSDWGLQAAEAAWEKGAAAWNEDPSALAADRQVMTAALSADVTQAWQTWLVDRFYQKVGMDTLTLAQTAGAADKQWLYQTDANGQVVYDAAGNPVVRTKTSGGDDANDTAWKAAMTASRQSLLGVWDQNVQAALPELMSAGADQAQLSDLASRIGAAYRDQYKRELDALYLQQVSRYASTRLYDQFSLKKKSSDDTAGTIVDQLIRDVKTGTDSGIQAVAASLSLTGSPVSADSQVNAAQWEASFKQVLDSGLAKWDVAEKSLLAHRADWENRAGASYQSGEASWAAAYAKMTKERTAWQNQLKQILATGQARWDGKQADLSQSIANATSQLDTQIAQEQTSKQQQVSALVDVYAQSQNLVTTAQTSGEYWFNRMVDPHSRGSSMVYSWADMNTWASNRMTEMTGRLQTELNGVSSDISSLTSFISKARSFNSSNVIGSVAGSVWNASGTVSFTTTSRYQLVSNHGTYWTDVTVISDWNFVWKNIVTKDINVLTARLNALKSHQADLLADIATLNSAKGALTMAAMSTANQSALKSIENYLSSTNTDAQNSWDSYNEAAYWLTKRTTYQAQADSAKGELSEGLAAVMGSGGNPQDVLSSTDLESGYLDEYQVELLKAQVQQQYWNREYQIARQVYAYATDTSTSRPTEAQEKAAWNQALAGYQTKKDAYAAAVAALAADGQTVAQRQASVDAAQTALETAKMALQAAQSNYTAVLSARASQGNTTFYDQQIGSYEQDLEKLYGLNGTSSDSLSSQLASYRSALRDYGYAQELQDVQSQLQSLVEGVPAQGTGAGTPSLASLQQTASGLLEAAGAVNTPAAIPVSDPRYGAAAAAVQAAWASASGSDKDLAAAQYEAYYRAYSERVTNDLRQRQAQVALMVSGTGAGWYQSQTGKTSTDVAASLKTDQAAADGQLLQARLKLAQEAWGSLASRSPAQTAEGRIFAALIAAQKNPGAAQARAWTAALGQLLALGDAQDWWSDPGAHRSAISAATGSVTDPALRAALKNYLAGRSDIAMSTGSGIDASQLLVSGPRQTDDQAALLSSVWQQDALSSASGIALNQAQALSGWQSLLTGLGWSSSGSAADAGAIGDTLTSWAATGILESGVSKAVSQIRGLEAGLRPDLRDAAETLASAIMNLAALKAQGSGTPDVIGAQAQAQTAHAAADGLASLYGSLSATGLSAQASLARLASLAVWARGSAVADPTLSTRLDSSLAGTLATNIAQAYLASSSLSWPDAAAQASAGLPVRQAVLDAAVSQAQSLCTRLGSNSVTLMAQMSADPSSSQLGAYSADSAHLDLAMSVWNWTGLSQDAKISAWRQSLDTAASVPVEHLFSSWNSANAAGQSGITTVMDGLSTQAAAAQSVWAWFQTTFGGTLLASTDANYASQQTQISTYLATLTDVSQAGWAGQLFASLQSEADQGRWDLSAVLTDVLGASAHSRIADAWTLLKTSPHALDGVVGSSDPAAAAQGILMAGWVASQAPSDSGYAAWLLGNLVQAASSGISLTDTLVDAVGPGVHQALAAARGSGALAALRERFLAVTLASQTSASQYAFLAGLSGIQAYGSIDASVYGSGQAFDQTYQGFSSDQTTTDVVLGWYLKAKAAAGTPADSSLLNKLSSSARSGVSAFLAVQSAEDGYVAGLGQDAVTYAQGTSDPEAVLSALSTGQWDDDYWLASLAGSRADPSTITGQVGTWRQTGSGVLIPGVAAALAADTNQAQQDAVSADTAVLFRRSVAAWQQRTASEDSYRASLFDLKDASGDGLTTVLTKPASSTGYADQALFELVQAADGFNAGLAETRSTSVLDDFVSRYARFVQGDADWSDADVYRPSDAVANAYSVASDNLNQTRGQLADDQAQIVKLGAIRAMVANPPNDAQTNAKAAAVQNAIAAYNAALSSLDATMQSLSASMTVYNEDYVTSNAAYQTAEDARYVFEAQDQIFTYAQNGYLSADDPTLQLAGYHSPAQLLATAQAMKTRSQTVLDTLSLVTPSASNAQNQVAAADASYFSATGDLLSLTALQDQLAAQIARQDVIATSYGQTYEDATGALVTLTPGQLKDSDTVWGDYLLADSTKGLSLNFDLNTFVLGTRNTAQSEAWTAYTTDPVSYDQFKTGTFDANLESWSASMQSWAKNDAGGYQNTLKTWGLAYDYLMFQIKKNNSAAANLDKMRDVSLTKDLNVDSDQSLDDFFLGNDADLERDIQGKSGNNNYTYLTSYRAWIRTQLQNAWNAVKADTAHWQLFQNALAFRLTDSLPNAGVFDQSGKQTAFSYIRSQTQSSADSHNKSSSQLAGISAGFAAGAAVAAFCWNFPLAAYLGAQAGLFGVLAADEHQKGVQQQNEADKAKNIYDGLQTVISNGMAVASFNDQSVAWNNYSSAWNTLQTLKGANAGTSQITVATLKLSLTTAMTQRHSSVSAADKATVEKWFGQLSAADKTDSVTALAAIIRLSQNSQNNSKQDLASKFASLQTQFQADEAAYQSLEARYLAGDTTVSLAQLQAQAQAAYGSPVYTALVQAQKQMAEDSALTAASTTPLAGTESRKSALVARMANTISQLEAVRLAHLKEVRLNEWAIRQQELNTQEQRWENQVTATVVKSQQAWSDSFAKLNTGYQSWKASFSQEYQDKSDAWSAMYQTFQWNRRQWVDAVATSADQAQNQVWAITAGQAADAAISQSALILVGDMASGMVSADSIVGQILGSCSLGDYLQGAQRINGSLAAVSSSLRQGMKYNVSTTNSLAAITIVQNTRDDDLAQHAALIVAAQARDNLAQAQASYKDQVVSANDSVDKQMDQTFLGTGYGKTGGKYTRRSIIGSTIGGPLYETQNVDTYKPFTGADFTVSVSLDDASLKGLDAGAVQARVDTAMQQLKAAAEKVFGKKDAGTTVTFTINKSGDNNFTDKDAGGDKTKARDVEKTTGAGDFGTYLGYAPEMKSDPDLDTDNLAAGYKSSVLIPGPGETGRLIGWYQYFAMRASKGWAEQDQPFYSQKLYDDRHSWIKAPTLKDVAMTGVAIAAALTTGGVGGALIGALETTSVSSVFAMADVAHGAEAGQTWGNFAKGAAVTALATALTMGTANFATGLNGMEGFAGTMARTAYATGMAVADKGISSAVNAVKWTDGHLGFSTDAFTSQWDPTNAANYASIAMAATSAGVSSLVNQGGFGFLGSKLSSYNQVGNMVGSLASAGVSYAMTGDAAFNVANFSMFGRGDGGNGIASAGLLELHLGKNGTSMNLGQGGADVGYQAIQAVGNGLKVWDENSAINTKAAQIQAAGLEENLGVGMRSLASNIDAGSTALYASIMNGTTTFLDSSSLNAVAQTKTGANGNRVISFGNQRTGNDGLDMSVLLAHEAVRDGVWDGSVAQTLETRDAAMNHMNMAMDIEAGYGSWGLSRNNAAEANVYSAYKAGEISGSAMNEYIGQNYNSSSDFWKLTSNGNLSYDGKANLYDENGNLIRQTNSQGVEGSLLELLGLPDTATNRQAVVKLMKASGMKMSTEGKWVGTSVSVANQLPRAGGTFVRDGVDLTAMNIGKEIPLSSITQFYKTMGVDKAVYQSFVERNYMSAMSYLSYTAQQTDQSWSQDLYQKAYTPAERAMIQTNIGFLQSVQQNGINYDKMVPGTQQTTGFGVSSFVELATTSTEGAKFFLEDHTGLDFGGNGSTVNVPGGSWRVTDKTKDKLYLQLLGTDVRMRIQHLDPSNVRVIDLGAIVGDGGSGEKIVDYPTSSNGSGTGTHVHIDFTKSLPYEDVYQRAFVSPSNWSYVPRLEYQYTYFDSNRNPLAGYPRYFSRF